MSANESSESSAPPINAAKMNEEEIMEYYEVEKTEGLTSKQAADRVTEFGLNELDAEDATPLWQLVLEQFDDLLVKILLGSALLSFVLVIIQGESEEGIAAFVEPIVILLILFLNAIVGVWQERNAENALEALKQLQPKHTKCIRDGKMIGEFPAEKLVPGDIVLVGPGDKIPADLRVLELQSTTLRVEESALTGESVTALKQTEGLDLEDDAGVREKHNMLFSGTTVSGGKALCAVILTGMRTEIGRIQAEVTAEEDEKTPLKKKLDEFGNNLSKVIGLICLAVWVMNYKQFFDPVHGDVFNGCIYYLKIAVALGVAAIPEGLPAVITLCLALGTRRMVKKNCIVRKLPSVETLGCVSTICSDKTGTLTLNEMTAVSLVCVGDSAKDLREFSVVGESYNPAGHVEGLARLDESAIAIARVCALCNDATVNYSEEEQKFVRIGEPTEAALKVLAEKIGHTGGEETAHAYYTEECERRALLEFSRGRKSMSVIVKKEDEDENILLCKGAPEKVLERCTRVLLADGSVVGLSQSAREAIQEQVTAMASRPLRVLAFAQKMELRDLADYDGSKHEAHHTLECDPDTYTEIESYMVFLGLAGIKDPARPEVAGSIETCREAGIRVIMITGDNQETAEAIAKEIGIFSEGESIEGKSYTGKEFNRMSEEAKEELLKGRGGRVFSRTDPTDKQDIVNILKRLDEVPAMTGDGVNDAPALKAASIGIAMGIAGTEVAKEASDMVLADDNFATIVHAVEEGRAIYSNMKAFIRYLISSNIGEVASIFFTAALGFPEGLIPVQLLWVNLVTDGPPATALGFNPPDADIMQVPPRRSDDQLITKWVFTRYMIVGLYVGFATVGIFAYWYMYYDWNNDGHTLVTFEQLSHWGQCPTWTDFKPNDFIGLSFKENPCNYFQEGKVKASTLSLSVLVTIEMVNSLNALSENGSLLQMPPWTNPWLLLAITASMLLHCMILYIPLFNTVFELVPLTWADWQLVLAFSLPVLLIDEVLKFVGRMMQAAENKERKAALLKKEN